MLAWRSSGLAALFDLAVPPRCAGCGSPLVSGADVVCAGCRRALPWLPRDLCRRCALPVGAAASRRHRCPARDQAFDAAWSAVAYAGVARDLVAALKFSGARPLAAVLAAHLAAGLPAALRDGRTLVPVPAHPARVRARGYDQALLLARALAARTGAPLVPRAVRRAGPASRQLGASRDVRLAEGRIAVTARRPAPRRVLLVDDVHTTGATLDACARALRGAGAEDVVAATWARTL
jgi:ComF family protein